MNDITALMATMKAAAEKAKHAGEAPVMNFYERIDALNEFQLATCPANVLALVEALEKAQQRIAELENDEVRQRLANAEHQLHMAELAKHNLKASRKAQFRKRRAAEQRVAELEREKVAYESVAMALRDDMRESRTVTVKLPEYPEPSDPFLRMNMKAVRIMDVKAMTVAGIQVIEGEQKNG